MSAPTDDPDSLLAQLDADKNNPTLRERTARALSDAARPAEAFEVLRDTLAHLTAHDDPQGPAPCLCRRCIQPTVDAVVVGGVALRRDFVVERGRVLYFWSPASIGAQASAAREAVRASLGKRLGGSKSSAGRRP